jgi:hypothetical protein
VGVAGKPAARPDASSIWQLDACRAAGSRLIGTARASSVLPSAGTIREVTAVSVALSVPGYPSGTASSSASPAASASRSRDRVVTNTWSTTGPLSRTYLILVA